MQLGSFSQSGGGGGQSMPLGPQSGGGGQFIPVPGSLSSGGGGGQQ